MADRRRSLRYRRLLLHIQRRAPSADFEAKVERVNEANLRVTYRYPLERDANAAPRGQAVSEFYYDEESGSVVHTGEFPPQ
ncbi:LppP/LprE family lipoprotein [Kocuria rhizophila]|uniref:LppP/LprE family lipoprotein n=1 Tax=Kocuria rhizophila TaxID=72000 RepID=UPI0030B819E6